MDIFFTINTIIQDRGVVKLKRLVAAVSSATAGAGTGAGAAGSNKLKNRQTAITVCSELSYPTGRAAQPYKDIS